MSLVAWMVVAGALAEPVSLEDAVCTSQERVVMSPELQRRFQPRRPCKSLVSAESVADYFKAFAVVYRDLADPGTADRMAKHFEARWLLIKDGSSYRAWDTESGAFVEDAVFAASARGEPMTDAQIAAESAYKEGYRALRSQRNDTARAKLTECLEQDPEHLGCHWELGWVHWVAEDFAAAADAWTEVEKRDPDWPELKDWLLQARAQIPAEDPPEASAEEPAESTPADAPEAEADEVVLKAGPGTVTTLDDGRLRTTWTSVPLPGVLKDTDDTLIVVLEGVKTSQAASAEFFLASDAPNGFAETDYIGSLAVVSGMKTTKPEHRLEIHDVRRKGEPRLTGRTTLRSLDDFSIVMIVRVGTVEIERIRLLAKEI